MDKNSKIPKVTCDKIIWLMIAAHVVIFCYLSFLKYYAFGYFDWDFASDLTILYNSAHGRLLYYPFLEQNIFGAHLYLIIFFIIPIYAVFQHPLTLLFLQSLFLGLAAYPLYLFAASKLDRPFALAVSLAYLLYPSIGFINLFETHFEIYEIFFLFFAILYFERGNFKKFMIFILLALLCKENVSLVVFMFGFYGILRRRSLRWIVTPLLLGAGWFFLAVKIVIPYFAKDSNLYQEGFIFSSYYRHLGSTMLAMLQTTMVHPLAVLRFAFSRGKYFYPLFLFLPVGFLGFFSPGVLLMTLPIFAQNLLSSMWPHSQINYHYTALLVPFIFVSTVWTLKKNLGLKAGHAYRYFFLAAFLSVSILAGFFLEAPQLRIREYVRSFSIDDAARAKQRLVQSIPPNASVMATFQFLPHLANRKDLYSLHLVSMGYKMYTQTKYVPPEGLEYVLVDFNESLMVGSFFPPDAPANIRTFLERGNWRVQDARDDVVLFTKDGAKTDALCKPGSDLSVKSKFNINFADKIAFLGYDIIREHNASGNVIHFVYYWKRLGEAGHPLGLSLNFLGPKGDIIFQKMHSFGYRIYPPDAFPEGEVIQEHHYVSIPDNIMQGSCEVKMSLFVLGDGQILPVGQDERVDSLGRVILGKVRLSS
ncbi:MAG: DUF2079 domain-containing protein [Candidatus Omnitrophota bacterium]